MNAKSNCLNPPVIDLGSQIVAESSPNAVPILDLQINTNETESIPLTEYFPVFLIPLFLQSLLCSDPKFRLSIWLGGRLAVQAVGLRQLTKA
jgi:hypothetical protein